MIQAGTLTSSRRAPARGGEYARIRSRKLFIAVGEWLFGWTPFGWRFSAAVFGSLAILLMCRIARRMTRSTLLADRRLLMSLDAWSSGLKPYGILDIFGMFFVSRRSAPALDRDVSRGRASPTRWLGLCLTTPAALGIRKWRLPPAGVHRIACALQVGRHLVLLAFAAWHRLGHRRTPGRRDPQLQVRPLIRDAKWATRHLGVVPLRRLPCLVDRMVVTRDGYDRNTPSCTACIRHHLGAVLAVRVPRVDTPVSASP